MKKRTFIISKANQYIQGIELKAGRYTISYSIKTPYTSHRFAFLGKSGVWHDFEIHATDYILQADYLGSTLEE